MTGALVIGGDYRALGIARSLGRRGIPVWVALEGTDSRARFSRHVCRSVPWPDADDRAQLAYLLRLGRREGLDGWVLFPTSDETAALLSRHHSELAEGFRLTVPPWEAMEWAYDKRLTYARAAELGVSVPWTRVPAGREELAGLERQFPLLLKPAVKRRSNRFTDDKVWRVDDRPALLARYDEACALIDPALVMVQELIPGSGERQLSFAALCSNGRPLASLVARRTRQYPADFGHSSCFIETTDLPAVEESARRLLRGTGFTGLVELEFKGDARTGALSLLDVNPRVWTWHTVGRPAGVDFPVLAYRLSMGLAVEEARGRPGVRWVYMATDLPAAAVEMRRGRLTMRSYLRGLRRPLEFAVLARDDPLPLAAGPLRALRVARRALARRRQGRGRCRAGARAPR